MPDIQSFQAILQGHADEDLMGRLRRLGEAGCTGSMVVFNDELFGIVFFTDGTVVDAIVIEGPWQGQGVQAVAFLANAADAQVLYQPTAHFGERTIDMGWKELEDRVALLRRILPVHRPPRTAEGSDEVPSGRMMGDDFPLFGDLFESQEVPPAPHREPRFFRPVTSSDLSDAVDAGASETPPSVPQSPAKSLLDEIREVDGYQASAILDRTGDLLWTDVLADVDLPLLAGVFNDVFRAAGRVCRRQGLGACRTLVVHAEDAAVVVHCSGATGKGPHLHAAAVLTADGNQALMRLQLERALPRVSAALA